jgi:salicylate hydroxylase
MLPFLAQGAAMGIEDAWALSNLIAAGSDDAAAQFQQERAERCNRVQQQARDNMKLFHHHSPLMRAGRDLVARSLAAFNPEMASRRVKWIYDWEAEPAQNFSGERSGLA